MVTRLPCRVEIVPQRGANAVDVTVTLGPPAHGLTTAWMHVWEPSSPRVGRGWLAHGIAHAKRDLQAEYKARELLRRFLNPEQRYLFERTGAFRCWGSHTRSVYVVKTQYAVAVAPSADRELCIVAGDRAVPRGDLMLAAKALIETDEDSFLAVAEP